MPFFMLPLAGLPTATGRVVLGVLRFTQSGFQVFVRFLCLDCCGCSSAGGGFEDVAKGPLKPSTLNRNFRIWGFGWRSEDLPDRAGWLSRVA